MVARVGQSLQFTDSTEKGEKKTPLYRWVGGLFS